MINEVEATIKRYGLIIPGDLVIVGVSGGPDSLALLHVLHILSKKGDFSLHAAHLNHSFRGQEADEEALWVKKIAESWGIPCTVAQEDIPALIEQTGMSPQEAGHQARQRFFLSLLRELKGQKIALGHQADDQAETIFIHLLSGAGPEGLQGIRPYNPPFIRPLLFISRQEIEEYCRKNDLEPRRDPSNYKNVYLRNKIRNQLLPWIKENINPNLVESLQRTAIILQDEEDYWQEVIKSCLQQYGTKTEEEVRLDLSKFVNEQKAVQRRIIRYIYQKLTGRQGPAFIHAEQICQLAKQSQVGKKIILPGGLVVIRQYQDLLFTGSYQEEKSLPLSPRVLKIPGETLIPEKGMVIKATISQQLPLRAENRVWFPLNPERLPELHVRSRLPGDWLKPIGMSGRKKLKDFFIDRKIPKAERDHILLVACGPEVLWIPGLVVSNRMKETKTAAQYLILELIRQK